MVEVDGDGDQEAFRHRPVMVTEVTELLGPVPPGPVLDATVGAGGHARALLEAHAHIEVVGLDRDADALAAAAAVLRPLGDRVVLRQARFDHMTMICQELGHRQVSGVLFDLGVSSPQLDRAERGFSYGADGPLDMRMDRGQDVTAADVVNTYGEEELARVLATFGDERFARRIARAIVAARPLSRTSELADVVRAAIPAPARRRGGHPARRTFQAIRIEVNRELEILPGALDQAVDLLGPGGRCVVLAYHSGEDRIVKQRFAEAASGGCLCPPGLPCVCGAQPQVRLLRRGARPSAAEVEANPRSESARLRAVEKLLDGAADDEGAGVAA
jgi:16S rRNA (cytosine1402-N4)-methyltransferase